MTVDDLVAIFECNENTVGAFDKLPNKRSKRADLHVLLLLDSLVEDVSGSIIEGAEHDKVFLRNPDDIAERITEEQVMELIACGVFIEDDRLAMFV